MPVLPISHHPFYSVAQQSLGEKQGDQIESLSKAEIRATANSLVDILQKQLLRERQQKRELMEHLKLLESQNKVK